jgi:nucleotide-binding universal stress UspA family protein
MMQTVNPFRKILVGVDGSEHSKKAVEIAVAEAKAYGAQLTIVHVIPRPTYPVAGSEGIDADDYFAAARNEAKAWVDSAVKLAQSKDVRAVGVIFESVSVVKAFLDYAAKDNVDLIVLGTRGLSDFKRLLIGSISSGVVNHAHCSVLVVR